MFGVSLHHWDCHLEVTATSAVGAYARNVRQLFVGLLGHPALPPWPQDSPECPRAGGFIEQASRDNHPFPSCTSLGQPETLRSQQETNSFVLSEDISFTAQNV